MNKVNCTDMHATATRMVAKTGTRRELVAHQYRLELKYDTEHSSQRLCSHYIEISLESGDNRGDISLCTCSTYSKLGDTVIQTLTEI
jgi:hypothetical protein